MKLSILMLTHNRVNVTKKYMPLIIDRVGTNIEVEFLIWDNGSTDGTYAWATKTYGKHPRVKFFKSKKNYGVEAINFLAEKAKSKYILKIDDDVIPPVNYGQRLTTMYEYLHLPKLLFLGWDMRWGNKTFATRSGLFMYEDTQGTTYVLPEGKALIHYDPSTWMVNGVCRLCESDKFFQIGGHPSGVVYGVDYAVSKQAAQHGYWIGFFSPNDLVQHMGSDSPSQRTFKDAELRRHKNPKHV